MTNTPELDADGNPINPGGEDKVVLSKEEHTKIVSELAAKAQAEASLLQEVTDLRKKNRDLEDKKVVPEPTEVQKVVQEELAKKEVEQAKSNFEAVTNSFLASHPEFSTENDPGGIKFKAFQKSLSRINLSGLKTIEEFEEAFQDAYSLMDRKATTDPMNPSSPRSSSRAPAVQPNAQLPSNEMALVKSHFGGNVEAYLKAKAKKPVYFEELLKWTR